jgi:hypothetical protein
MQSTTPSSQAFLAMDISVAAGPGHGWLLEGGDRWRSIHIP